MNDICSPRRNPCGEHSRCLAIGDDIGDNQKYVCICHWELGYRGRHCTELRPPRYAPPTPCNELKGGCFIDTVDVFQVCYEDSDYSEKIHTCDLDASVCRPREENLWDFECVCREGFEDSCLKECDTSSHPIACYQSCMTDVGMGNQCTPVVVEYVTPVFGGPFLE